MNEIPPIPQQIYTIDRFYTLNELRGGNIEGVDPSKKELYLSDPEFLSHFGVTKKDFNGFAKWKHQSEKKRLGIF